MTSDRNKAAVITASAVATGDDAMLDAARAAILAVGWKRTTLTDVARRAGVSRMTLYRRWPDMQALLADLMTREWGGALVAVDDGSPLDRLRYAVGALCSRVREDPLFAKILEVDPELLLPYLLDRRGRTQDLVLTHLETLLAEGQAAGEVRAGRPTLLARTLLLATHGFVLSHRTMLGDGIDADDLADELDRLVTGYLRP